MQTQKVLFVLTSCAKLGNTGHKTGAFLSEITHPYDEFQKAGYHVDMISPLGGVVPLDGVKMEDPLNVTWMNDEEFLDKIQKTLKPADIHVNDYCAVYFVGGHGAMFDFPDDNRLQEIARAIYENNGVVGAVCHGAAALINLKTSDGNYLVNGHEISCFTNLEEESIGMERAMPFLLQTKLESRGAQFSSSPKFAGHVVKSGRLVTGQNPASSAGVGRGMVEVLDFLNEGRPLPDQNWCEWKEPQKSQPISGAV